LRLSGGGEGALLEGERDRFATGGAVMVGVVLCKLLVRTTVHRVDAMKMTRALKDIPTSDPSHRQECRLQPSEYCTPTIIA
jgi:hypothetical protein